jgi:hypothetical protein
MINPRRFCLASVLGLLLVLVVSAAPARAREFKLKGGTDTTNPCNAGARFRLTVSFAKGKVKEVKDFQTYGVNYPHTLPDNSAGFPIPFGVPSGECFPGYDGWESHEWQCPDGPEQLCTEILTGGQDPVFEADQPNNEFHGVFVDDIRNAGICECDTITVETKEVVGTVHVKRNKKTHKFKVRAIGTFAEALGGESGLEWGGVASTPLSYTAHN